MNKKVMLGIIGCIILFWCCRIYSINQIRESQYQIQMGEELQCKSIHIVPLESYLFSRKNFLEYFHLTEDVLEYDAENCRYICISLLVSNVTEEDISWDFVMDTTSCGFETKTWASITDFNIGSKINSFKDDCLQVGKSQKIWYVTAVNPISFKNKTWKKMQCKDFSYLLSLTPPKTKIQLE